MKLVPIDSIETERLEPDDDKLETGRWYWHTGEGHDGKPVRDLRCLVHVGSNYAELTSVGNSSLRVPLANFDDECELEINPGAYIDGKIAHHQENVVKLLDQAKQLCARLGVTSRDAIADQAQQSNALAVASGTADIKKHKKALIKAKEKTLPEIFKAVEKEHERLATWMKARLIPMKAELHAQRDVIEAIGQRIFTVELYAGLVEELEQIREGAPAPNDAKIALFQRRHYMDEECLVNYQAGGMEFKNLKAFDRWLLAPENMSRVLPHARCCVAFRVRRDSKQRSVDLSNFIHVMELEKLDKLTFLYIRNGEQVFRLNTEIDFDKQLFPDVDRSTLLGGGEIYIKRHGGEPISQRQYDSLVLDYNERKASFERAHAEWSAQPEAERSKLREPWWHDWSDPADYEQLTPDHVYYDDTMEEIQKEATAHNRIAVVLQGLLDRSPAFSPHPPWRLWTGDGFILGIELIYDDSKALTSGDAPDFEAYRTQLNKSIKAGSMTLGQRGAWAAHEAERYNNRPDRRGDRDRKWYQPYGNPGPDQIAAVDALVRVDKARFNWIRTHKSDRSWRPVPGGIPTTFVCPISELFNVSAYTPGDFKLFYADPRTRADYLKWAPYLLAAEDWHAGKTKETK